MENVSRRVAEIVKQESKPKRGINNKTSTLRAQAIRAKIAEGSEWSSTGGPSKAGYASFDSRSKSVLPPIKSVRNTNSKSNFFEEESKGAMGGRKHSLEPRGPLNYASPQMKL